MSASDFSRGLRCACVRACAQSYFDVIHQHQLRSSVSIVPGAETFICAFVFVYLVAARGKPDMLKNNLHVEKCLFIRAHCGLTRNKLIFFCPSLANELEVTTVEAFLCTPLLNRCKHQLELKKSITSNVSSYLIAVEPRVT